jgi:putative inorganic carbon (hco3(-)) transporter
VLTLSATFGALWATWQFLAGTAARASGPISDPNDFAYLMAVVLPLAGMLAAREPRWRVAWLACCAALICAILASLSRGALVGLAAVGLWLVLTRKVAPSMILFAGGLMLASAIAVPTFVQTKLLVRSHGASTTGSQRLVYWDAASRMALDRPLFGFGPDRFQTAGLPYIQNPVRRDKNVDANSTCGFSLRRRTGSRPCWSSLRSWHRSGAR